MFAKMKQRINDVKTIDKLCVGAEVKAHEHGEDKPGAEHFLLSALDLPDATARRALDRLGVGPDKINTAIDQQYRDALSGIGMDPALWDKLDSDIAVKPNGRSLYQTKASGQVIMQELAAYRKEHPQGPLVSAHVLLLTAQMKQGVIARTLKSLDIDIKELHSAAIAEINSHLRLDGNNPA